MNTTKKQILITIKEFMKHKFAWPGGYEIHLVMSDGETLCHGCAVKNKGQIFASTVSGARDGWAAIGTDINYEYTNQYCAHCNKQIEPAYGDAANEGD